MIFQNEGEKNGVGRNYIDVNAGGYFYGKHRTV